MEFSCPACAAPHAFPDDQVPAGGIVVACTRCGAHITLTRAGVVGAQSLKSEPPVEEPPSAQEATVGMMSPLLEPPAPRAPTPAPPPRTAEAPRAPEPPRTAEAPRAPSVAPPPAAEPPRSAKDTAKADKEAAKEAAKAEKEAAKAAKSAAKDAGKATPPKEGEDDMARTAAEGSGLFGAAKKAMAAAKNRAEGALDSAASEAIAPNIPEGLAFPGAPPLTDRWTWRDLPKALAGVLDLRRLVMATIGFTAALIAFGLLGWVGGLLGSLWGPLGSLFNMVAWLGFVGVAFLVVAVLSYVVYQTTIERKACTVKAGFDWARASIKTVVGTPLAFVGVIGAVWVAQFVVGMVGRIPFAGPILWGAVSPVTLVLSLVAGLAALGLFLALPLYIPVIYHEKTDIKPTLQRLLDLFRTRGFELALYLVPVLLILGIVLMTLITLAGGVGMGGARAGFGMENLVQVLAGTPPGMAFGLPLPTGGGNVDFQYDLAGWLFGIGSSVAPALVMSVFTLVYATAGAITHSILTGRTKEIP